MSDRVNIKHGHGATNTVNDFEYYNLVIATCSHICDVLKSHCGPYATDALLITDNHRNLKDRHYAKFTKDGINIVKSIEFVSPIQKHIQSLIVYIGERVDSLSHDGTTTSMMLFTLLVKSYFETFICDDDDIEYKPGFTDRRLLKSDIIQKLNKLIFDLERDVITVDILMKDFNLSRIQAIKFISYHQAMLSSKNDLELSNAITEVVETLPVELYGLFSVTQSGVESDKRFNVIKEEYNYALAVHGNIDDYNHNMGTEYLSESCDMIVSEDDLSRGNPALELVIKHVETFHNLAYPVTWDVGHVGVQNPAFIVDDKSPLFNKIKPGTVVKLVSQLNPFENGLWIYHGEGLSLTRPEDGKDLIILAKSVDSTLMEQTRVINRRSKNKIVIFTMSVPNPYSSKCTVLSALLATAGKYHLLDHLENPSCKYLIQDVKVHFKNRRLYISNLYEKDGTQYHPYFNNPEAFEPYTKMVKALKEELDGFISGKLRFESAQDKFKYQDYVEIYRRMICAEVRNLEISGMTHDVLADYDVLQDSFGAVLSSLENGFVLDGYLKLSMYVQNMPGNEHSRSIMQDAIMSILSFTHKTSISEINDVVSTAIDVGDQRYSFYPVGGTFSHIGFGEDNLIDILDMNGGTTTLVMQPADTYRELFRRLSDLLPKLINTNRAIIPGTVNEGIVQ